MNFIELHEEKTGFSFVLPLDAIISIRQTDDLRAFVETHLSFKGESIGFYTKELYIEVLKRIHVLENIQLSTSRKLD